jgi:membrane-associated protease RseP (regulator of RpoE activity)
MKKWTIFSVSLVALLMASVSYGQDVGVGAGDAGAQAGPGGASAQSGDAAVQATPGDASAQTGEIGVDADAGAGASANTQNGLDTNVGAGADPTFQGSPDRLSADANAQLSSGEAFGLGFGPADTSGQVTISNVTPDGAAARIGLRTGDRIVSVNGVDVTSSRVFIDSMGRTNSNARGDIVVLRDGRRHTLQASFAPWHAVYGRQGARTHTTFRPNYDAGQPAAYGGGYAGQGYASYDNCCQPVYQPVCCCDNWQGGRRGRRW